MFFGCLSAEDFTLERIIELGLDQFADQICEVSGAASKELSIEQVGLFHLMCLKQKAFWSPCVLFFFCAFCCVVFCFAVLHCIVL